MSPVLFKPLLAGATLRDRLLAACGAFAGIALAALVTALASPDAQHLVWLVPPMGASAVLLFAVPASPMAQPWPTIGGNVISALIGILLAHALPLSPLSAGLAVALAIAAMSLTRSLHPPGGAAALVGLFAGPAAGWTFPLLPVGLNALLLVGAAFLYHRVSGHSFPHRAPPQPAAASGPLPPWTFRAADLAATLETMGETFDIGAQDLERLLRDIERRSLARAYRDLTCSELMTIGVIGIGASASADAARQLLVRNDIRRLAVVDDEGRIAGAIGLRELASGAASVAESLVSATTARPGDPAIGLIDRFARDRAHAVFIIDDDRRPVGVITEADWLAVLTKGLR